MPPPIITGNPVAELSSNVDSMRLQLGALHAQLFTAQRENTELKAQLAQMREEARHAHGVHMSATTAVKDTNQFVETERSGRRQAEILLAAANQEIASLREQLAASRTEATAFRQELSVMTKKHDAILAETTRAYERLRSEKMHDEHKCSGLASKERSQADLIRMLEQDLRLATKANTELNEKVCLSARLSGCPVSQHCAYRLQHWKRCAGGILSQPRRSRIDA